MTTSRQPSPALRWAHGWLFLVVFEATGRFQVDAFCPVSTPRQVPLNVGNRRSVRMSMSPFFFNRRDSLQQMSMISSLFNLFDNSKPVLPPDESVRARIRPTRAASKGQNGPTNALMRQDPTSGMRYRRLGGSDIVVSELGLGTQRWVSDDYNAPTQEECFQFMDTAILENGVNLIDTAEQYPIPSNDRAGVKEGDTELVIGQWMKDRKVPRENVVLSTKITGGRNVTPQNIVKDCEGSLKRLQTDYIDVYLLHWPQRYSPQSNWGQSMEYNLEADSNLYWRGLGGPTPFEELCRAMEGLVHQGKIRSWGLCNDNAYGLTASARTAAALGTTPPCCLQGDYSLLDRKSDENGVAEAASPYNENVGFMAYNALAGGMLTGKYMDVPAAMDDNIRDRAIASLEKPRGRHDTRGWGVTLYRYRTEAAQQALVEYNQIAKQAGLSLTELALRWCRQRTLLTTTLVGHSNLSQLKESLACFTNPERLSEDVMWEIDRVHMKNRLPLFSSNRVGKDWYGSGEIGERIP